MINLLDTTTLMKAISLWQPWASLIAAGVKPDETRHWPTSHRGLIAIHAAKTIDVAGAPDDLCAAALGENWSRTVPIGMIVAVAELTACRGALVATSERLTRANHRAGNFTLGRYAWRFDRIRPLIRPIPATGRQGIFNWSSPADLAELLGPVADHKAICRRLGWA